MVKKESELQTVDLQALLSGMSETGNGSDEYIPTTDIELTHAIVEQLFDDANIKMISDLTETEIKGILKLQTLNKMLYNGEPSLLSSVVDNLLVLKVSKNRQGRSELIKAISSTREGEADIKKGFKRFLG